MDSSLLALMMLSLLLGCGCWLLFLWAVKDGQFTDIERPKHRMLHDDEDLDGCMTGGDGRRDDTRPQRGQAPHPSPPPPGEGT